MGYATPRESFEPLSEESLAMLIDTVQRLYPAPSVCMQGVFSREEFEALLYISEATTTDPRFAADSMKSACFEAVVEQRLSDFDFRDITFLGKVWRMAPFDLFATAVWGNAYWAGIEGNCPKSISAKSGTAQ